LQDHVFVMRAVWQFVVLVVRRDTLWYYRCCNAETFTLFMGTQYHRTKRKVGLVTTQWYMLIMTELTRAVKWQVRRSAGTIIRARSGDPARELDSELSDLLQEAVATPRGTHAVGVGQRRTAISRLSCWNCHAQRRTLSPVSICHSATFASIAVISCKYNNNNANTNKWSK